MSKINELEEPITNIKAEIKPVIARKSNDVQFYMFYEKNKESSIWEFKGIIKESQINDFIANEILEGKKNKLNKFFNKSLSKEKNQNHKELRDKVLKKDKEEILLVPIEEASYICITPELDEEY